jgi:phosphatidylserine decarboxylase
VISKYGTDVVIRFFLIAAIVMLCTFTLVESGFIRLVILVILSVAVIFVINFFRDPNRIVPKDEGLVISPADGKVVLIKEFYESEYIQQEAVQVSIFMSPLNVHVNRFPISGVVSYFKYIQGKYLVAFNEKSSELNERTHIGIENNGYKVIFKQIAGAVARRIVADVTVGQKATAGERFGMIKFGSRVDVIMPKKSEVKVNLGEHVRAGESVIARYSNTTEGIS